MLRLFHFHDNDVLIPYKSFFFKNCMTQFGTMLFYCNKGFFILHRFHIPCIFDFTWES